MAAYQQVNNYLSNHYDGMEPEQLILMLFNGAISRLRLAGEGIRENDVKKRGENLSKAIAIISELNASVDPNMNDESTQFLRGLYAAILTELPKASLNNDMKILDRSRRYISGLKEIWEKEVLGKKKRPEPVSSKITAQKPALPSAFQTHNPTYTFSAISV